MAWNVSISDPRRYNGVKLRQSQGGIVETAEAGFHFLTHYLSIINIAIHRQCSISW